MTRISFIQPRKRAADISPEAMAEQTRAFLEKGGKVDSTPCGPRPVPAPPADFERARKRALAKMRTPKRTPVDPEPPEAA